MNGIKELWKLCFHDSDEFVDMYFRLRYSSETTMYIQSGSMIVSSLQMPYYAMTFEGTGIQTAYISGACTHPDFRGKGIMARLLTESFGRMARKNIPLSILIPANPGLVDYYARTGYACAFFRSRIERKVSDIVIDKGNLHIEHTINFGRSIFDYFTEKAYSRSNYVQHTTADLEAVIEDLRISGGSVTVARHAPQGRIAGLLFAYPENGYLKITEWFADNDGVRDNLIREAACHYQLPKVVRFELPTRSAGEQPFGMARIINAKMILSLYATAHPEKRISIQLTDEQLVCNNGYYYIDNGVCIFSPKALENEHLGLTAHELSAMIFDRTRLYMSLMLEE
ncbi:MAG: GNAT family N-acetyltransferase [Mediterranea sp.]|jgi:predicted acetyltransferase|nr:GNAT family N-acetyltransferase [Mediterranea sp.]